MIGQVFLDSSLSQANWVCAKLGLRKTGLVKLGNTLLQGERFVYTVALVFFSFFGPGL